MIKNLIFDFGKVLMKKIHLIIILAMLAISGFAQKPSKTDSKVCIAIRNYLLGRKGAAILTETAKKDIFESSWPEVQCSVEGTLDSPGTFKNLKVIKVAKDRYKYECTCPLHGDKFVDFCTMTATLGKDGKIRITHVTWDK